MSKKKAEKSERRAVTRASDHTYDCEWHHDQYPEECTCGAIREGSNGQGTQ